MTEDLVSLITAETKIKVSSTLDKTVAKRCLTDGSPDTCWTSQQGLPQCIQFTFAAPVIPKRIHLTFQGGFTATQCSVQVQGQGEDGPQWHTLTRIYPEDANRRQSFDLAAHNEEVANKLVQNIKLVFEQSSDFFGRITVYDVHLEGKQA